MQISSMSEAVREKYGDDRRTEFMEGEAGEINIEDRHRRRNGDHGQPTHGTQAAAIRLSQQAPRRQGPHRLRTREEDVVATVCRSNHSYYDFSDGTRLWSGPREPEWPWWKKESPSPTSCRLRKAKRSRDLAVKEFEATSSSSGHPQGGTKRRRCRVQQSPGGSSRGSGEGDAVTRARHRRDRANINRHPRGMEIRSGERRAARAGPHGVRA